MSLSRRLRAAVVLAALWGVPWAIGGATLGVYRMRHAGYFFDRAPGPAGLVRIVLAFAAVWGGIGTLNGLAFAAVLATLGRRAGPGTITPVRVAGWGALAGVVSAAVFLTFIAAMDASGWPPGAPIALLGGAILGALCALATLALAGGSSRLMPQGATNDPGT